MFLFLLSFPAISQNSEGLGRNILHLISVDSLEKINQLRMIAKEIPLFLSEKKVDTSLSLYDMMKFNTLPKEQFPGIVVPTISVTTIYVGNSPKDMENLVTCPIEKRLKEISGAKWNKITSTSKTDLSLIIVEFDTDVKTDLAKQKVKDAIDKARLDLPNDLTSEPDAQEGSRVKTYLEIYPTMINSILERIQTIRNDHENFPINWNEIRVTNFAANVSSDESGKQVKEPSLNMLEFESNGEFYILFYDTVEWPKEVFKLGYFIDIKKGNISKNLLYR